MGYDFLHLRYPSRLSTILFLKRLDSLNTLKDLLVAVNVKKTYLNFDISNSVNIVLEHLNFTQLANDGYYFVCSLHAPTCNYVNWYWTDYFYFVLCRWFFVHIKLCCFYLTFKVGLLNYHLYTPCDLRYYKLSITEKRCTREDSLSLCMRTNVAFSDMLRAKENHWIVLLEIITKLVVYYIRNLLNR